MVLVLALFSCSNESENESGSTGKFQISPTKLISKMITKSFNPTVYDLSNVKIAKFKIKDAAGVETPYSCSIIRNGDTYTDPIELKKGDYTLTQFELYDREDGNILFATPKAGSKQAVNVTKPLDIPFTVESDKVVNKTFVEVVSTEGQNATDFGLQEFVIVQVPTIIYRLYVLDATTKEPINGAMLQIPIDTKTYMDTLKGISKYIQVKEQSNYIMNVSANGYEAQSINYTKEQLADKSIFIYLNQQKFDLTKGLVAYYPFDNDANDYSGHNLNGTIKNVLNDIGISGNSYKFKGKDSSYIKIQNSTYLNLNNTFSFSIWIKLNNSAYSNLGYSFIIHKGNEYNFFIDDDANKINTYKIRGNSQNNNNSITTSNFRSDIFDGIWHHLVFLSDVSKNEMKIYLDGILEKTNNNNVLNQILDNNPLFFGFDGNENYLKGNIDQVRIYNRVLNQLEINSIYENKK